jgi:hypothetical protein
MLVPGFLTCAVARDRELALAAAGVVPDGPEALRLTVSELASFYTVAWATATLLAPLTAVESPSRCRRGQVAALAPGWHLRVP